MLQNGGVHVHSGSVLCLSCYFVLLILSSSCLPVFSFCHTLVWLEFCEFLFSIFLWECQHTFRCCDTMTNKLPYVHMSLCPSGSLAFCQVTAILHASTAQCKKLCLMFRCVKEALSQKNMHFVKLLCQLSWEFLWNWHNAVNKCIIPAFCFFFLVRYISWYRWNCLVM